MKTETKSDVSNPLQLYVSRYFTGMSRGISIIRNIFYAVREEVRFVPTLCHVVTIGVVTGFLLKFQYPQPLYIYM